MQGEQTSPRGSGSCDWKASGERYSGKSISSAAGFCIVSVRFYDWFWVENDSPDADSDFSGHEANYQFVMEFLGPEVSSSVEAEAT